MSYQPFDTRWSSEDLQKASIEHIVAVEASVLDERRADMAQAWQNTLRIPILLGMAAGFVFVLIAVGWGANKGLNSSSLSTAQELTAYHQLYCTIGEVSEPFGSSTSEYRTPDCKDILFNQERAVTALAIYEVVRTNNQLRSAMIMREVLRVSGFFTGVILCLLGGLFTIAKFTDLQSTALTISGAPGVSGTLTTSSPGLFAMGVGAILISICIVVPTRAGTSELGAASISESAETEVVIPIEEE